MRVTEGSTVAAALAGVGSTSSKLAQLQSQLSSGRQITQPSDDPAGTASAGEPHMVTSSTAFIHS